MRKSFPCRPMLRVFSFSNSHDLFGWPYTGPMNSTLTFVQMTFKMSLPGSSSALQPTLLFSNRTWLTKGRSHMQPRFNAANDKLIVFTYTPIPNSFSISNFVFGSTLLATAILDSFSLFYLPNSIIQTFILHHISLLLYIKLMILANYVG